MKNLLTLIVWLFLADSLSAAAQTSLSKVEGIQKLDEKYGFRDLKFETPIAQCKGMVATGPASHGSRIYQRPTDSRKIGTYALSGISYTFYKGKLASVTLTTRGYTNGQGMLTALRSLYGPGSQDNPYIEDYRWGGEKVLMSFEQNSATDAATAYIWSLPLMDAEEADKQAAAQKAKSDL